MVRITARVLTFATLRLDEAGVVIGRSVCQAQAWVEDLGDGVTLELVTVPAGSYNMGSLRGPDAGEQPAHRVTVPAFRLGRGSVTQGQWRAVMGKTPHCRFTGSELPVDSISWQAAERFCARLSVRTGRAYRLPSEAQWEYACRAGTAGPFSWGETITTGAANYNGQFVFRAESTGHYRHATTEAGHFPPNPFGLFDMHGNVWEWCADHWHPDYRGAPTDGRAWVFGGVPARRVARGGCWHDTPAACRSAARLAFPAEEGDEFVGFRVMLPSAS
jgi:formylglycine-generating enzyme required for sulfatase activity